MRGAFNSGFMLFPPSQTRLWSAVYSQQSGRVHKRVCCEQPKRLFTICALHQELMRFVNNCVVRADMKATKLHDPLRMDLRMSQISLFSYL